MDFDKLPDVSGSRKPRWSWRKRLLIVAILLGVGVPLILWAWGGLEARKFNRRMQRLREAGLPTRPEDFNIARIPDEQNAAVELLNAANSVDDTSDAWKAADKIYQLRLPLFPDELSNIRAVLAENEQAFALTQSAVKRTGVDWQLTYQTPMIEVLLPHLNGQRKLAYVLKMSALASHVDGDDRAALDRIRETLFMSRAMDEHPMLVGHLVAVGIGGLGIDTAGDIATDLRISDSPPAASPRQVRALIAELLDDAPVQEKGIRAYHGERVMGMDALQAILDGKVSGTPGRGIPGPIPRSRAFLLRNASALSDYYDALLSVVKDSRDWPTLRDRFNATPTLLRRSPQVYYVANMFAAGERGMRQNFQYLTQRHLTATALAIALYRSEHNGQMPGKLADLVPDYLPAVPADLLAAGAPPIRFNPDSERPRLYSVGENGVDDGGTPVDETLPRAQNERNSDLVLDLRRQPKPPPPPTEEDDGILEDAPATSPTTQDSP
jgi:hypothetical protein